MSAFDHSSAARVDGVGAEALAARLGVPRVMLFESVGSTLDVAHRIAPESPSGTVIVADEQTAGRGRQGRKWTSAPGAGLWLTVVERPSDLRALDVLALRCGLFAAESLDALAGALVQVKWPNDLYVRDRKLAGILIETRWRGTAADWVAIGFGLNIVDPELPTGVGLAPGATRLAALECVVPALRAAAASTRHLTADELSRWHDRDVAADRAVTAPSSGIAAGITPAGELRIVSDAGAVTTHRTGSLTFAEPLACS